MQKFRHFFSVFSLFLLFGSIFSPVYVSLGFRDIYDYTEYVDEIKNTSGSAFIEQKIVFDSPRTTFFLQFYPSESASRGIEVEWVVDGKSYTRELDLDDRKDDSEEVFSTFPLVTEARSDITIRIRNANVSGTIGLISSNQAPVGKRLTFDPLLAEADGEGPHIITRAEWGADETLRYLSPTTRMARIDEWRARSMKPRFIEETPLERQDRIEGDRQFSALASENPKAYEIQSVERYDGKNKLLWPIERTRKVDRIVIHHTAENLQQNADDKTLLRAIYLYHTKTKGWGDIGYNFVVGQRGDIYEGRAGGDYVKGAHVYGNNSGTVGISLIGNYDDLHLNKEQKAGMIEAITYVTQKYGISLSEDAIGIKKCGSNEGCIWKKNTTKRLSGHRDTGSTDCPGQNLYEMIPTFIDTVVGNVGNIQPIYNTLPKSIDPVDPEDQIEYVLKSDEPQVLVPKNTSGSLISSPNLVPSIQNLLLSQKIDTPLVSKLPLGPTVKIRLSYPSENTSISLESATRKNAILLIGKRRIALGSQSQVALTLTGSNMLEATIGKKKYVANSFTLQGDIIRIPSWSRIPDWDKTGKNNDNLFRSKIILRNEGGKLLVINELPREYYLRGMGEVSESVDVKNYPEKVKALIVAARSYVTYYQNPKLALKDRKFGTRLYDISDSPDESQVYKGYGYEMRSPNFVKLVEATNGEVVAYRGELIKVWYFSSSSGRTLSYKEYCESRGNKNCLDIPYLQSVEDPGGVGKTQSGHGVGISGIGATYFAREGWDYRKIIQYYLKGVEITKK